MPPKRIKAKKAKLSSTRRKQASNGKPTASTPRQSKKLGTIESQQNAGTNLAVLTQAIEVEEVPRNSDNETPKSKKPIRILFRLLDFVSILFWTYAIVRIFVIDVDRWLFVEFLPEYEWLVDYRILLFLALAVVFVIAFTKGEMALVLAYVAFFPLIILIWKLPKALFYTNDWRLGFAFVSASAHFFRSFRFHVVSTSMWVIGLVIGATVNDKALLVASIVMLLGICAISNIFRFVSLFTRSPLLTAFGKALGLMRNFIVDKHKKEFASRRSEVAFTEPELDLWRSNLELSLLFNRAALYSARQFQTYQSSGLATVGATLTILRMFIGTVVTFSVVNWALYKFDSSTFIADSDTALFQFFYYSFNTMMFSDVANLTPATALSQSIRMIEIVFGFLLLGIFVTLIITLKSQRSTEETQSLVDLLRQQGSEMGEFIRTSFQFYSLEDALQELNKVPGALTKIMLYFSQRL